MSRKNKDPAGVTAFLSSTLPFSELPPEVVEKAARACCVDFFPKDEMILVQDTTVADSLLLIQRGAVKNFIVDEHGTETLVDVRGEGASLGVMSIIENKPCTMNAQSVEDTFVISMPKEVFADLLENRPCVANFYLKNFSRNYLSKAFMDMRKRRTVVTTESGLYLFRAHVGELSAKKPVSIPFGRTIQQAAAGMTRFNVGSVLIREPSGDMAGIVTDTDIRKAVALGLDYITPVETIMSAPVAAIGEHEVCFDALLKMMERHIHHLAVTKNGQVAGMITSHDIMVKQGKSPLAIFREIMGKGEIEELYPVTAMVPEVVRTLVQEGAKAGNITRLITVLNDMILKRVLTLLLKKLGPPPVSFCWLLMGSEGRKEQTFATDQDNALVYMDSGHEAVQKAASIYFTAFADQAIHHLVACGFPPCKGWIMANNPKWLMPLSRWQQTFTDWINVPEPMQVLHSTIFFDFRSGYGQEELALELRETVNTHARGADVFLRYLAANCLETRPPLSFFRNFIVEKNGEHKNRLDIKTRGLVPFMDFARVLALRHGIGETTTLGRLRLLKEGEHIPVELYRDAAGAFEFLLQVRLIHQLRLVEQGQTPDNHIDPAELTELEKRTLKDSFQIILRMQSFLKEMFRLNV